MPHLTRTQILTIVDRTAVEPELTNLKAHLKQCDRCASLVAREQQIVQAAKRMPLEETSRAFTARVMQRVVPASAETGFLRVVSSAGRILAMAVVVGVVGYTLSLNLENLSEKSRGAPSEAVQTINRVYQDFLTDLSVRSKQVSQGMVESAGSDVWKTAGMVFLAFVALGAVDRYVLRPLVRLKL